MSEMTERVFCGSQGGTCAEEDGVVSCEPVYLKVRYMRATQVLDAVLKQTSHEMRVCSQDASSRRME